MDGRTGTAEYYTHTEETRAFQQEFELAKQRQDAQLENIEKGLATLKGAAIHGRWKPLCLCMEDKLRARGAR